MQKNARKLAQNTLGSLVETVDTVDTVETVQTDHMKKFECCQLELLDAGASEKKMRMGRRIQILSEQVVKQKKNTIMDNVAAKFESQH